MADRRYAVSAMPETPGNNSVGTTVRDLILKLGNDGDCDWRTLIVSVRRTENLGNSGLPDLLVASAEPTSSYAAGGVT